MQIKIVKVLFFITFIFYSSLKGQERNGKPVVGEDCYRDWCSLHQYLISDDGKLVAYTYGPVNGNEVLAIQDIKGRIKNEVIGGDNVSIASDCRSVVYRIGDSVLCIFDAVSKKAEYIYRVQGYLLIRAKEEPIVFCKLLNGDLIVKMLKSKRTLRYSDVQRFVVCRQIDALVIMKNDKLLRINLSNGRQELIFEGNILSELYLDDNSAQLAFISGKDSSKSLMYYGFENSILVELATDLFLKQGLNYSIGNENLSFSKDGKKIFFTINKLFPVLPKKENVKVDVWNYKDRYLQSEQSMDNGKMRDKFNGVVNIENKFLFKIENEEELILSPKSNKYILLQERPSRDIFFQKEGWPSLLLVSTTTGIRRKIMTKECSSLGNIPPSLSPGENYVVWFDADNLCYYSYDIIHDKKNNISDLIPYAIYDEEAKRIGRNGGWGIAGWLPDDEGVLIYDQYDIWKVDLSGNKAPVNITNEYGRKNKLIFSLMNSQENVIEKINGIVLAGVDLSNKQNGFWKLSGNGKGNPRKCVMEDCYYYLPKNPRLGTGWIEYPIVPPPLKAKNADVFLITKMTAEQSPNLYTTHDFKEFIKVTNIHPEEKYNWLTARLIKWKMYNGQISQGILYMPENFDSTKKYPLIFDFYEKRSNELHKYIAPEYSVGRINIPTYVSNGYLIFVPDIYYTQGHNGEGTINSVLSAASFLSKFSWIDSTRLGIQGHSFGGWQTNFLVTHSNIFSAACEVAGNADLVSSYGGLLGTNYQGRSRNSFYELNSQGSPYGLNVTPWTQPDVYIRNSPIFYLSNVTTPLLMVHCKNDPAVPFSQAIELFTGLRRAGKKVWLLQYDDEEHTLGGLASQDFTLRMRQFFDHYLMNKIAPVWMTKGIPFYNKGSEKGLNGDTTNVSP